MKNARHFILLAMFLPLIITAQRSVSGEGDVVRQEIQLEALHAIGLGISCDVILTQGAPQKIVLEGQQNVLDNIKREVRNGSWTINFERNVHKSRDVKIYITLQDLTDVSVSGSGSISSTNRFKGLKDLELAVSGSGEISLDIEALTVEAAVSGSGDIDLQGSARSIEIAISGSGDVDAQGLQTQHCEIAISGSGDARVYCSESLEAAVSGSGDIGYKGGASMVKAAVHGSGDIKKMD